MKLLQSYFNNNITPDDINYSGGYLSAIVNWLSMAYSCLLLKRNNPDKQLFFYGNETIVRLFESMFQLPYDEYKVVECTGEYADWFYCWPKIVTYQKQSEPFIHIDTDVFMWKPIPKRLLQASLVAQHRERDSNFYMEVYKQIGNDCIQLPQYLEGCNDGKYINSYNAGLLGGNDIDFFKSYVDEILKFLDINKGKFLQSDRKFLYNVVFEQWLFYGLARKKNKNVSTFYKDVITDFDMEKAKVPQQLLSLEDLDYLHVMEYKDNIRCNRFIAYQMQAEFPQEYERILSVCRKNGIKSDFYSSYTCDNIQDSNIFVRSKRLKIEYGLSNEELEELVKFETITANFFLQFQSCRKAVLEAQIEHRKKMSQCVANNMKTGDIKRVILSPYIKIVNANSSLVNLLLYNADKKLPKDVVIVLVYNAIFNRVDEFIWTRQRLQLLLSLIEESSKTYDFLINSSGNAKVNGISTFCKQCLFDGIITLK